MTNFPLGINKVYIYLSIYLMQRHSRGVLLSLRKLKLKELFLNGMIQSPLTTDLVCLLLCVFCLINSPSGGGAIPLRTLKTRHILENLVR